MGNRAPVNETIQNCSICFQGVFAKTLACLPNHEDDFCSRWLHNEQITNSGPVATWGNCACKPPRLPHVYAAPYITVLRCAP